MQASEAFGDAGEVTKPRERGVSNLTSEKDRKKVESSQFLGRHAEDTSENDATKEEGEEVSGCKYREGGQKEVVRMDVRCTHFLSGMV